MTDPPEASAGNTDMPSGTPLGPSARLQVVTLDMLVPGTPLWMRDPRRTPVVVTSTEPATASFSVEVTGFEDVGAVWDFALWDVTKFLAEPGAPRLTAAALTALTSRVAELHRLMTIPCRTEDRQRSAARIQVLSRDAAQLLSAEHVVTDGMAQGQMPETDRAKLQAMFRRWLESQNLTALDEAFVRAWSSNPNAGEFLKGHRIVLAELGLCPYDGPVPRCADLFAGDRAKPARADHILARLAFLRALFATAGLHEIALYRTIYSDTGLTAPVNTSLVSATFRQDVALSFLAAGQKTRAAALYWQNVPVWRVLMTCLETPDLSHPFDEAEAVLLHDPEATLF